MVERSTSIGGKKSGKYSCVKFSFFAEIDKKLKIMEQKREGI